MPEATDLVYKYSALKNPEIDVLESYDKDPGPSFWENFPKNCEFSNNSSNIDYEKLDVMLNSTHELTEAQILRGKTAVEYLKSGAPAFQTSSLPSCNVKNTPLTGKNGSSVTDTIATWTKQRIVCGPFNSPPTQKIQSKWSYGYRTGGQS